MRSCCHNLATQEIVMQKSVHFRSEAQKAQCGTCAVKWHRLNCVCSGLPNEA